MPAAASCDFPGHPGPAGHINACQLCPTSPTYWRDQAAADSAKPCRWTTRANTDAPPAADIEGRARRAH